MACEDCTESAGWRGITDLAWWSLTFGCGTCADEDGKQ